MAQQSSRLWLHRVPWGNGVHRMFHVMRAMDCQGYCHKDLGNKE